VRAALSWNDITNSPSHLIGVQCINDGLQLNSVSR